MRPSIGRVLKSRNGFAHEVNKQNGGVPMPGGQLYRQGRTQW